MDSIPIIDISALHHDTEGKQKVAEEISNACRHYGFFYVVNHGVDEDLQNKLETLSKKFFALPLEVKNKIRMELGGKAWRGYFPVGDELTSGKPDIKEGIYLGEELDSTHHLVQADAPFYGANLFPDDEIPEFRSTVIEYMAQINALGHKIMEGIALSLGLDEKYFFDRYTKEPLQLFRIFNYPAYNLKEGEEVYGVGSHTDYGLCKLKKIILSMENIIYDFCF